mmetsp:Transcript_28552/g.50743  ORF Transcript_28552/g.50743 Transcript_28552/m.50743 type:complete len:330 (+) Transcript_28552:2003-2992(+)
MESDLVINSISFRHDYEAFAVATSRGFRLYKTSPLRLLARSNLDHPLKICEMLPRSHIFAIVGTSLTDPVYNHRSVVFWENMNHQRIGGKVYQSEVKGVKMRADKVVVAADNSIFVYSFPDMNLLKTLNTGLNPEGLLCITHETPDLIACPHPDTGSVYILKGDSETVIKAHKRELSEIALNKLGTIVATTSAQGTIIRLFSTTDHSKLFEFRRGVTSAAITSLIFHPTEELLACSSVKGTVHLYSLIEGQNQSSRFWLAGAILPSYFSSEWSSLNFRVPEGPNRVGFVKDGHVVVVKFDGNLHLGSYARAERGECLQLSVENFLELSS